MDILESCQVKKSKHSIPNFHYLPVHLSLSSRPGDQLVKVNGQDISGMSSSESDSLLKSVPRGTVTLLVRPSELLPPQPEAKEKGEHTFLSAQ